MTFEQLCESMGWELLGKPFGDCEDHEWWDLEEQICVADINSLTAAGAIAVQTEYRLETEWTLKDYCLASSPTESLSAVAPDIPTAIRDCALEIEL